MGLCNKETIMMTWEPIHVFTVLKSVINPPILTFRHIICIVIGIALQYDMISHQCSDPIVSLFLIYKYFRSILGKYRFLLRNLWKSCWWLQVGVMWSCSHSCSAHSTDNAWQWWWSADWSCFNLFFIFIWSYYLISFIVVLQLCCVWLGLAVIYGGL